MYAAFFGLNREPFSIAPDPRLLFMSEQHREALAHLLYGIHGGGGFVLLTGEIGTGKTTVCRSFLEQVPDNCNLAYIFNPKLTVAELLETVCQELGIEVPARDLLPPTAKDCIDALNAFLLKSHAEGRDNVLVIDEAQNLSADVLEQLRLLTNLETADRKLLQIILIGQPELRTMLQRPELEQLAQRVIARYHLGPLAEAETAQYIRHRMEACGLQRPLPFDARALARIHQVTGGIPRRINLLCDRALLGAYATGEATVTRRIVDQAAREVFDDAPRVGVSRVPWGAVAAGAMVAGVAALLWGAQRNDMQARSAAVSGPVGEVSAPAARLAAPAASAASAASAAAANVPAAVPVAAPASAPPKPPELLAEPAAAWRELAAAWKLDPGSGDPCEALARQQVQCFDRKLTLAVIRQLNRPGIVTLDAATGKPSFAVLTALTDRSATLRAAGTEQTVTIAALAQRWDGDFGTLWRVPPGYAGRIADGQGGDTVAWVAQRLANGKALPANPTLDNALKQRVRAFQVAQGLPADGRPGPLTFMQLNRMAGVDEPRLRSEP